MYQDKILEPFGMIGYQDSELGRIYFLLDDKLPIQDRAICEGNKEELKLVAYRLNKIWKEYHNG